MNLYFALVAALLATSVASAQDCPEPIECAETEMLCVEDQQMPTCMCPGDWFPSCPVEYCIPATVPSGCPNHCYYHCPFDMVPCDGGYDSMGCPMPDICMPNWDQCPMPLYDFMGCPVYEPCPEDTVDCPVPTGDSCPPPPNCLPTTYEGVKGKQCGTLCEQDPVEDHVFCPGGVDMDGCNVPGTWVPTGTECPPSYFDDQGCPLLAGPPPQPTENEQLCPRGISLGCHLGFDVVPIDKCCPHPSFDVSYQYAEVSAAA